LPKASDCERRENRIAGNADQFARRHGKISVSEVKKMSEQQNSYRYLEWRPHRWRKTPYIKGRRIWVWHLLEQMWANNMTPEEIAQDFGLPVEAVYEALDYYEKHRELLEAEVEEERRRLREHGINV
jgi:uncharacterized protein (DUF433 family)